MNLISKSPEYQVWADFKYRCNNPNHRYYNDYGGRGITYHFLWENFENFYKDMGKRPSSKHSLDRINNELGYCKDNCKWATLKEQLLNRRPYRTKKGLLPGVRKLKNRHNYQSAITMNKKIVYLGTFSTEQEAHDRFIQERNKRQSTKGISIPTEAIKEITTDT